MKTELAKKMNSSYKWQIVSFCLQIKTKLEQGGSQKCCYKKEISNQGFSVGLAIFCLVLGLGIFGIMGFCLFGFVVGFL